MVQFTNTEKTEFLLIYGECNRNARLACRTYSDRFLDRRCPDHKTLKALVHNLQVHGSFTKPRRERIKPVRNQGNIQNVINSVNENPHTSVSTITNATTVSSTSVRRILKDNGYHDYKMILIQELRPEDYERRVNFIAEMSVLKETTENFLYNILWSDECTFNENGSINRHNMHFWSSRNPFWTRQRNFQVRFKVNVWAGILGGRLIGPHFFENNLNAVVYLDFLQNYLSRYLENVPLLERENIWFQQDGAPPHNANIVKNYLNRIFENQWIGTSGPLRWPARSPDLNPLDYFLWGYLKTVVYETQPRDIDDLKSRIRNACNSIRRHVLLRTVNGHLVKRFNLCIRVNGQNFEQFLKSSAE